MTLKYEVLQHRVSHNIKYFRHGQPHRIGGPAKVWRCKDMFWYQYNKRHRSDGPAVIWSPDNSKHYYIRGEEYTKEDYYNDFKI